MEMFPLLMIALLIWAGVFSFVFAVDRKVSRLEQRIRQNFDATATGNTGTTALRRFPEEFAESPGESHGMPNANFREEDDR